MVKRWPAWLLLVVAVAVFGCTPAPRTPPAGPSPTDQVSTASHSPTPDGTNPAPTSTGPTSTGSTSTGSTSTGSRTWVQRENDLPGTGDWRLRNGADDAELAGFADQTGVSPGAEVSLRITCTAKSYIVIAYRLGHYRGLGAREVWRSDSQAALVQPKTVVGPDNMVTAPWSVSLRVPTQGWVPGSYLLKLISDAGKQKYIPLTVRSQAYAGRLVLISATSTYQAYNEYGGYSLYRGPQGFDDRARRVSFDRPYDRNGARLVTGFEQPVIALAERLGLDLAYATSEDLDAGAQQLSGARGLVSPGHDEYWSTGMRASVERLRDDGTNLAFLGANGVYWRIRFEDSVAGPQRNIAGYKSKTEDPQKGSSDPTIMWRQDPGSLPENSLTGMLYECFPARGPMKIIAPDFFLFDQTNATEMSVFTGLIGVEIDRAYPLDGTPKSLQVVAHSPVSCADRGNTYSDMVYYTTAAGSGVFSVGTMYWTKALLDPVEANSGIGPESSTFATKVTENLFADMARGPMGVRHPARPNLAEINASASTSTGTGGPIG